MLFHFLKTTSIYDSISGSNVAWNTTGQTVAGTGVAGSAANQLSSPWNLYVDANKNLYIADSANHRIQYWPASASSGTTIAGVSGSSGSSTSQLNEPSDITVDANGNFYVADRGNSRIQFFRNGTTTGSTVSSSWGSVGGFRGVQVTSSGIIYGSDTTNHVLWRNNSRVLNNSHQLNGNQGIALDTTVNSGYLYIANTNQHTVLQWIPVSSSATVVAGTNGVSGSSNSTLRAPVAVRLDLWGNLYIVDNNNHRIQLYCRYPTVTTTGRTIVGTGSLGSTSTTLNYPTGLAVDNDLNLYVADTSNHRIQKFSRLP